MSRPPKMGVIQSARGVAALAVVFFHADLAISSATGVSAVIPPLVLGTRGVDFFFVLSGFIIWRVHAADVGRRSQAAAFARKRFVRIYPTLWLIAGFSLLANFLVDGQQYSLDEVFTSLTLFPSAAWPVPIVAWSLRHEILFYVAFWALIMLPRVGAVLAIAWASACLARIPLEAAGIEFAGLARMIFSPLNLQFALGVVAAFVYARWRAPKPIWLVGLAAIGLIAVVALYFLFNATAREPLAYKTGAESAWDLLFGIAFSFLVYALANASDRLRQPRIMVFAGDASYATYLVHPMVLGVSARLLAGHVSLIVARSGLVHIGLAAICLAVGGAIHLIFERPIMSLANSRAGQPA